MHLGAEWVLQPVRDGDWWNVVDREKCSAVGEGYPAETRLYGRPKGCARGGGQEDPSLGDRKELRPRGQRLKGTYHR